MRALSESGKRIEGIYPVPVITMSTLNVVIPLMLDETLSVIVAAATWLAVNVVPSLSQVAVIGPLAFVGLQFALVIVRVI
jgi:hypothetical protein